MHIAERDAFRRRGHHPAAAVTLLGNDEARLAQAGHKPAEHHGVGAHRRGECFGGEGSIGLCQVQEDVQDVGKLAALLHATILVA